MPVVNVPEFDLNAPFDPGTLDTAGMTEQETSGCQEPYVEKRLHQ